MAPETVRDRLRGDDVPPDCHLHRVPSRRCRQPATAVKSGLRSLAGRYQSLDAEVRDLEKQLDVLTSETDPLLRSRFGVGPDTSAALLLAAGDNPARLRSDSSFSMLCGSSPVPASSGQTKRHRLNRRGDRQAKSALHRIVMATLRWDEPSKAYMGKRLAEGQSKREVIRCLKRYVAREIYTVLTSSGERPCPSIGGFTTSRHLWTRWFETIEDLRLAHCWRSKIAIPRVAGRAPRSPRAFPDPRRNLVRGWQREYNCS